MGNADDGALYDPGITINDRLDFDRIDVESTRNNQVFFTTNNLHVTVFIGLCDVSRIEVAVLGK